jgi:hypothetical protein
LSYCVSVWKNNLKNKESLKPVIPVVFYHGKGKYDLPLNFGDYFDVPEELDIIECFERPVKKYVLVISQKK